MQLSKGATIAVADGEKFNLFRNDGDEAGLKLSPSAHAPINDDHQGATPGRRGSSANPDGGQDEEDGFSAGVADLLNKQVLDGKITALLIIAAPRTLGACVHSITPSWPPFWSARSPRISPDTACRTSRRPSLALSDPGGRTGSFGRVHKPWLAGPKA
jgi:protein required for attachment to host cells